MAVTHRAPTTVLHEHTVVVQLDPTGPVEAVGFIAVSEHAIDLDCTCGQHSVGRPQCHHALAAARRLYREGLVRRTSSAQGPSYVAV